MLSGGFTAAYMAKLFVVLFIERCDTTEVKKPYISRKSAVVLAVSAALLPVMGCFTAVMDTMAGWSQSFFHGHSPEHLHYFTWENLKGAVLSAAAGALVCLFAARGRRRTYAAWPEWLDMENLLYRPLLKLLLRAAGFIARAAAALPDKLALLVIRTVLRAGRKPMPGGFLLRQYQAFQRRLEPLREGSAMAGSFSLDLLLVSAGICVTLIYVFSRAFG
jgi:hydrogenase-4 component B